MIPAANIYHYVFHLLDSGVNDFTSEEAGIIADRVERAFVAACLEINAKGRVQGGTEEDNKTAREKGY